MGAGSGITREKIVLTHRAIDALKPAAEAYRVPDLRCAGLAIRVAPSGHKTWDFVVRIRGTSTIKRKALGAFPAVGLDEARERATAVARAAQSGRDLLNEEAEAKEVAAARMTVGELIEEYLKRATKGLRTRHEIGLRLRRSLETIADRPADTIKRRDLRILLNAVSDRGVQREAEKQRQSIGAMFKWALGQDIVSDNPARGLGTYSTGELRDRILTPAEIKTFWSWLPGSGMAQDYIDALRLQLCFGSRIGEAAGIAVEEIDQETWLWMLPAARSKNKKHRLTPIVGIAREIIERRLKQTRKGPLFMNERGNALASNDVGSSIVTRRKRIPIPHFVSHDLRRTVATELVEMGFAYELVAAILGHEVGDKNTRILTRHYVRSPMSERKRIALEAWDARLRAIIEGQVPANNVVQLANAIKQEMVS